MRAKFGSLLMIFFGKDYRLPQFLNISVLLSCLQQKLLAVQITFDFNTEVLASFKVTNYKTKHLKILHFNHNLLQNGANIFQRYLIRLKIASVSFRNIGLNCLPTKIGKSLANHKIGL